LQRFRSELLGFKGARTVTTYFVDLIRRDGLQTLELIVKADTIQEAKLRAVERLEERGHRPTDWEFRRIEAGES
jgi:hypothetical protein